MSLLLTLGICLIASKIKNKNVTNPKLNYKKIYIRSGSRCISLNKNNGSHIFINFHYLSVFKYFFDIISLTLLISLFRIFKIRMSSLTSSLVSFLRIFFSRSRAISIACS